MPHIHTSWRSVAATLTLLLVPQALVAQGGEALSLAAARDAAHRASPTITAAREAVAAARGRERQAGTYPNPTLAFDREQTSGDGQSNAQNVLGIAQPIELGGLRGVRRDVARARREAAEARLVLAQSELAFEVTRAYALAVAADRRVAIASQATLAFTEALRVSEQRLAAGDIAGYAHRRLRLEVVRYAAARAEATLVAQASRSALASLVSATDAPLAGAQLVLSDTLAVITAVPLPDSISLVTVALRSRAELRALALDAEAGAAEARLAVSERTPVPVLSAGFKRERIDAGATGRASLGGFVAGISVPLPLFDRRRGAVDAAQADARRQRALVDAQRRVVAREVIDAEDAYRVAREQVALLQPTLGANATAALAAAGVAHAEGEITLVEWLDVVRAYREAESGFATLQGELLIRRAALDRAVGAPYTITTQDGARRAPRE